MAPKSQALQNYSYNANGGPTVFIKANSMRNAMETAMRDYLRNTEKIHGNFNNLCLGVKRVQV